MVKGTNSGVRLSIDLWFHYKLKSWLGYIISLCLSFLYLQWDTHNVYCENMWSALHIEILYILATDTLSISLLLCVCLIEIQQTRFVKSSCLKRNDVTDTDFSGFETPLNERFSWVPSIFSDVLNCMHLSTFWLN